MHGEHNKEVILSFSLALLVVASPGLPAAAQEGITITGLGTLGGQMSAASSIDDHGWVVGYSYTTSGEKHAFLLKDNVMTDLGTLGGSDSYGNHINNRGEIASYSNTICYNLDQAVLWNISPEQQIEAIIDDLSDLVDDGVLNPG